MWLFANPWAAVHQASLSSAISWNFLKLMSIEAVMPSNCLILCHRPPPPALLVLVFPSISDLLSPQWVSSSHQVAKGLELLLQHQPFNEESGLISFRMDWFDLLALQRTLKSLLHHRLKASVLLHSTFMVQHSHPSPVSLPGEFHGLKSLVGYSLWGQKELETTERLSLSHIRTWLPEKP